MHCLVMTDEIDCESIRNEKTKEDTTGAAVKSSRSET